MGWRWRFCSTLSVVFCVHFLMGGMVEDIDGVKVIDVEASKVGLGEKRKREVEKEGGRK